MLDVIHVAKKIEHKQILEDCNFRVKPNTIFGIVGINGVGKSTLLKLCCGVLKPDKGEIFVGTETVFDNISAKQNLLFIPDDPYLELASTVESVMDFYYAFYELDKKYFNYIIKRFELNPKERVIKLSKGKKKRLYLSIALSIAPKLLFLDETFDGVDPFAKNIFKEEIKELMKRKDMTVILTSHSVKELVDISDNIGYLTKGKMIMLGDELYYDDPIYRVLVVREKFKAIPGLNILNKIVQENYYMIDVHNKKEDILQAFKDTDNLISTDLVPFNDWIIYQMEDLS